MTNIYKRPGFSPALPWDVTSRWGIVTSSSQLPTLCYFQLLTHLLPPVPQGASGKTGQVSKSKGAFSSSCGFGTPRQGSPGRQGQAPPPTQGGECLSDAPTGIPGG